MTNFEKIKAMSIEEMAKFIDGLLCGDIEMWHGFCDSCDSGKETRWCWQDECAKDLEKWLESEVKENACTCDK